MHGTGVKKTIRQSQLRKFITCTGIWLQHVSAVIGHHQRIQNTKLPKKDKYNSKLFLNDSRASSDDSL